MYYLQLIVSVWEPQLKCDLCWHIWGLNETLKEHHFLIRDFNSFAVKIIGIDSLDEILEMFYPTFTPWALSTFLGCFYVPLYGKIHTRMAFMCFDSAFCLLWKEKRKSLKSILEVIRMCNAPPTPTGPQPVSVLTSLWGSQISGFVHLFDSKLEGECPAYHSISDTQAFGSRACPWLVKPTLPHLNPNPQVVWAEPFGSF